MRLKIKIFIITLKLNMTQTFKVDRKQDVLMDYLTRFYIKEDNMEKFLNIVAPNSKISLRVIDWFVTNYSKKKNIIYKIGYNKEKKTYGGISEDLGEEYKKNRQFIVYLNYKSQLKSYSKRNFDPFCRRERIEYEYTDGKEVTTTVGQLNFFKWAIENCVIDYIVDHAQEIERDMVFTMKKNTPKGKGEGRKKRQELSVSATKSMNAHSCAVVLEFA